MKQHSPSPPAPHAIERPDGFYWQDESGEEYGPFETLAEALQDMEQAGADAEAEAESADFESLEETQAEMGVGWIDPLTGEPGENGSPRLEDH